MEKIEIVRATDKVAVRKGVLVVPQRMGLSHTCEVVGAAEFMEKWCGPHRRRPETVEQIHILPTFRTSFSLYFAISKGRDSHTPGTVVLACTQMHNPARPSSR